MDPHQVGVYVICVSWNVHMFQNLTFIVQSYCAFEVFFLFFFIFYFMCFCAIIPKNILDLIMLWLPRGLQPVNIDRDSYMTHYIDQFPVMLFGRCRLLYFLCGQFTSLYLFTSKLACSVFSALFIPFS